MSLNARRLRGEGRRLGIESLEERRVLAIDFQLLNIEASASAASSSPANFVAVGDKVFFTASDSTHGTELWMTDGSESGTTLVKDLNVGVYGGQFLSMTAANGMLFFASDNGNELWRSDGTTAGTVKLLDLMLPQYSPINSLVEFNGRLFFTVFSEGTTALWSSDGSTTGTARMFDGFWPAPFTSVYSLTNADGVLYFAGEDIVNGVELWKSDGTAAGTALVADIAPGTASSLSRGNNVFASAGGVTYFFADDKAHGRELWKTDGTAAGTAIVVDLTFGASGSVGNFAMPEVVSTGSDVYFVANLAGLSQLWKTNVASGATLVVGAALGLEAPTSLTNVAGTLMFSGTSPGRGTELWRGVDSLQGAEQVLDIYPGGAGSLVQQLVNVGGTLYFMARGPGVGASLTTWRSDGTTAGTKPLEFVEGVAADTRPSEVIAFGAPGEVLLSATIDGIGKELWRSAADSYSLVKDIAGTETGSSPDHLTPVGDLLYFTTYKSYSTSELWVTDGSSMGTVRLHEQMLAPSVPENRTMVEVNGVLYFSGGSAESGSELWRTDGTVAGTSLVADLRPGSASSGPGYLANVNGTLFFTAFDGSGEKLWKLDANGVPVPLTAAGIDFYRPEMVEAGGLLFFTADGGIWKSDGTAAGTTMLVDYGGANETPRYLTELNDNVYFSAGPSRSQWELWTSDGTAAGTVMLKDIAPGLYGSGPHALANVGGKLFFGATDGVHGVELWTSDGTAAGTTMVKESLPGGNGLSFIETMIDVAGKAFYYANNGVRGMWYSDGTSEGTGTIASLLPAGSSMQSRSFAKAGDRYYFEANDGIHGQEIWSTDLTPQGTWLEADLTGDSGGSVPSDFVVLNGKLFVTATSPTRGRELWVASLPPAAGDYDNNGRVDGNDFLVWQRHYGSTATPAGSGADGDKDGTIGAGDLAIWKDRFGTVTSEAVASVQSASVQAVQTAIQAVTLTPAQATVAATAADEAIALPSAEIVASVIADAVFARFDAAALMGPLAYRVADSSVRNIPVEEMTTFLAADRASRATAAITDAITDHDTDWRPGRGTTALLNREAGDGEETSRTPLGLTNLLDKTVSRTP